MTSAGRSVALAVVSNSVVGTNVVSRRLTGSEVAVVGDTLFLLSESSPIFLDVTKIDSETVCVARVTKYTGFIVVVALSWTAAAVRREK